MNSERRTFGLACLYFYRALRLRCPLCGLSPLFISLWKTRSLRDWFTPLDGCPRCGYPYEREPGYFLMSIWAINYGLGSLLGIIIYLVLEWLFEIPIWSLILLVLIPVILFNFFFARHSKALFLAFDLFCDPHEKEEGTDDRGNNIDEPLTPILPSDKGHQLPTKKTKNQLAIPSTLK